MRARTTTSNMAISLAVQLLLAGHCAGQTVDGGPIRVGDRWAYDVKDGFTGDPRPTFTVVVVEVTDKEITTRVTVRGKFPITQVFDRDWGGIDDGALRLSPSGIGIKTPLEVGNEWRSDATGMNVQSGESFRAMGAAKVVGQEQVTTPAGPFDTFRVDQTVRLVNSRDQTKSQIWTFAVWYAPAVNRWVRKKTEARFEGRLRESSWQELTQYWRNP